MTYVELKREVSYRGRRKSQTKIVPYDISDGLWEALQKCAEENDFCSVGIYDWNRGVLYMTRGNGVDEVFQQHCNAPKDWELYHEEVRKCINFELKEMMFKYEYTAEVLSVDLDNRTAFVQQFPTRRMIERGIYQGKKYNVNISDKCIYENIKPKDTILIRKFLNNTFLGVEVYESHT